MTDGQNWGWQPEQGYGRQYGQGQPWQAAQDDSGAQQGHGGWPPYPPPNPPTQVLYGPPGGPPGRKPWPARHKVLTALLGFCGLVFIIGIAAAASSSSSSTPAQTSSLISKTPAATPSPTVTKTATATQTVTTAPPTTSAQTAAAVQPAAPSTRAQTTSAAPPAPPASTAPASCYPLSNEGHCYEPGEYCRTSDRGTSGVAGDGEAIKCEDVNGWRWEPV